MKQVGIEVTLNDSSAQKSLDDLGKALHEINKNIVELAEMFSGAFKDIAASVNKGNDQLSDFQSNVSDSLSTINKSVIGVGAMATATKKLNQNTNNLKRSWASVSTDIKRGLAAFGGLGLIKKGYNNFMGGADIGFLSNDIGESIEDIQAYSQAVTKMGGSVDATRGSMKELAMRLRDVGTEGNMQAAVALGRLGISFHKADGGIRKASDVLADFSNAVQGLDAATAKRRGNELGLDDATIRFLRQNNTLVMEQLELEKKRLAFSRQDIEMSLKAKKAYAEFKQSLLSVSNMAIRYLVPVIEKMTRGLMSITEWMRRHEHFVKAFFLGFASVIGGVLLPILGRLAVANAVAFAPIYAALAAVTALALLYDDFKTWQSGGDSFFGDSWQGMSNLLKTLQPTLDSISNILNSLGGISLDFGLGLLIMQLEIINDLLVNLNTLLTEELSAKNVAKTVYSAVELIPGFGLILKSARGLGEVGSELLEETTEGTFSKILMSVVDFPREMKERLTSGTFIQRVPQGGDSTTTTHIENITINTQATDAKGIAKDIKREMNLYTIDSGTR